MVSPPPPKPRGGGLPFVLPSSFPPSFFFPSFLLLFLLPFFFPSFLSLFFPSFLLPFPFSFLPSLLRSYVSSTSGDALQHYCNQVSLISCASSCVAGPGGNCDCADLQNSGRVFPAAGERQVLTKRKKKQHQRGGDKRKKEASNSIEPTKTAFEKRRYGVEQEGLWSMNMKDLVPSQKLYLLSNLSLCGFWREHMVQGFTIEMMISTR